MPRQGRCLRHTYCLLPPPSPHFNDVHIKSYKEGVPRQDRCFLDNNSVTLYFIRGCLPPRVYLKLGSQKMTAA